MKDKKIIEYRVKSEFGKLSKALFEQCNQDSKGGYGRFDADSNVKDFYEKAGVLNIWFEPIYEEEFKVGDYIALNINDTSKFAAKNGYIAKVEKEFDGTYIDIKWITETVQQNGKYYPSDFRKATPIEVQTAQTRVITMYSSNKGEFEIEVIDGKAYYKPENKELPKEFIKIIINSFKDEDLQIGTIIFPYSIKTKTFVNVGCMHNTKKEDWEKVYNLLK